MGMGSVHTKKPVHGENFQLMESMYNHAVSQGIDLYRQYIIIIGLDCIPVLLPK